MSIASAATACLYNMLSVVLMHPAKATGQNEMPFGRDIRVDLSNTALDRGPDPPREGEILGVGTPVRSDAA